VEKEERRREGEGDREEGSREGGGRRRGRRREGIQRRDLERIKKRGRLRLRGRREPKRGREN
jgi:hypothetical protein